LSPSSVANGTAGTWITARLNASFTGSVTPGRANVTFTVVPAMPRSASDTFSIFVSTMGRESTWMIRSPSRTPPSSAGVCGNTRLTTTLVVPVVFCSSSSMPTPP
jgi:hypothetical protein